MKLLVNVLIMIALLSRGYAAGADGVGVIAHKHVKPALDRAVPLALPDAHDDGAWDTPSDHGHDHPHDQSHTQSTTGRAHGHGSLPIVRQAHARTASNHQHDQREAGVVYVIEDDSGTGASELLANLRALDGFIFIVAEPSALTYVSKRSRLPEARGSHFESRISDPAERPPDR